MTDEHETPLTPEQDQEVRRLLADARHTEPMPPDVVARMDGVIADLADEPSRRAPVVHLAARRRRVASLLVAAAAVVVVGIGIGQVVDTSGNGGDSDTAADSGGSSVEDEAPESMSGDAGSGEGADTGAPSARQPDTLTGEAFVAGSKLIQVNPDALSRDLAKVQSYADRADLAAAAPTDQSSTYRRVSRACRSGDWGTGTFVPVRYGSQPAVVAFRQPLGDVQVAEVYLCGNPDPVRSLTLPAP